MRKNAAALRALPFPGKAATYKKCRCCNEHAQNGHRAAARHAPLLKLAVNIGRDHQSIRRRDEACRHELAEGDNEDHHPPGKNAARDHRKRNAPEHIRRRAAEDPSRLQEAVVDLGEGGGHILHRVGKMQNHVGQHHDPDRVINRKHLVSPVPEQHAPDDKHDARQHFRKQTESFQRLFEKAPRFAHHNHDCCTEHGADRCRCDCEKQALPDGRECLRCLQKLFVVVQREVSGR